MQCKLSAFIVYVCIFELLQNRRVLVYCWTAEGTLGSENMIVFTKKLSWLLYSLDHVAWFCVLKVILHSWLEDCLFLFFLIVGKKTQTQNTKNLSPAKMTCNQGQHIVSLWKTCSQPKKSFRYTVICKVMVLNFSETSGVLQTLQPVVTHSGGSVSYKMQNWS